MYVSRIHLRVCGVRGLEMTPSTSRSLLLLGATPSSIAVAAALPRHLPPAPRACCRKRRRRRESSSSVSTSMPVAVESAERVSLSIGASIVFTRSTSMY